MSSATRSPLTDYPRSPETPFDPVGPHERDDGPDLRWRRARWSAYLSLEPHPEAPLSTRLAPILLDLVAADRGGGTLPAVPGSLYPAGFRRQVLADTGWPAGAIGLDPREASGPRTPGRQRVRALLDAPGDASPATLASLAALLNVCSLYRVTVAALGRHAAGSGQPALVYEVARAAYSLRPGAASTIRPFAVLANAADVALPVRMSATARLIAHYCRRDRDPDRCAPWAEAAERIVAAEPDPSFAARVGVSRLYRALGLYAWRLRDGARMTAMMRSALDSARAMAGVAAPGAEAVLAAQCERLVLEAALKAFVGSQGRVSLVDPADAADRLGELDPCDPYGQLIAGDTRWLLGDDEGALRGLATAARMGTFPGALAAHRAGTMLSRLDRCDEAGAWFRRAAELDPVAYAGAH